jgi:choline dehydrogenase-like flavoprotein
LRSNDPFDAPLIDPNYLANDFDVALIREGVKLARKMTTLPQFNGYVISSLTNATTDDEIDAFVRNGLNTFSHPVSTCAMSPRGANHGVVDPDLRLKGVDGIRVVDASILVQNLLTLKMTMPTKLFVCFTLAIYPGRSYSSVCLRCCREGFRYD